MGAMQLEVFLIRLVGIAVQVYIWLIFGRIILSWIRIDSVALRPVMVFIYDITEPFLALFRRLIPGIGASGIGIDFSPIIAILVLQLLVEPLVIYVIRFVFQLAAV